MCKTIQLTGKSIFIIIIYWMEKTEHSYQALRENHDPSDLLKNEFYLILFILMLFNLLLCYDIIGKW
jgi:hypothetical protein